MWTSSMQDCSVLRVNAAGTSLTRFDYSPWANGYACYTSGLAVDSNNHLWITSRTDPGFVIRVDANFDHAPVIAVVWDCGAAPAGVSIDNAGKPWATAISSCEAIRINPTTNLVDRDSNGNQVRVNLGPGAYPYNYGDMTGALRGAVPLPTLTQLCSQWLCRVSFRHCRDWLHHAAQGQLASDLQRLVGERELGCNRVDGDGACRHRPDGADACGKQSRAAVRRV